jgi:hypothetical protein
MTAEEFAHQLREDYLAAKLERARRPRPIQTNHPHSAGHPCDRYLVLLRVAWRLQTPMSDPIKAALFDEGRFQERALVEDLNALDGCAVILQKFPVALPDLEMVGEVDFFIHVFGPDSVFYYVADAKGVSTGIFKALNSWQDLLVHRRYFVRQWRDQLLLYLVGAMQDWSVRERVCPEAALLILKDKITGDIKAIPIPWDEKWWWETSGRFERLNKIVAHIKETLGEQADPTWTDQLNQLRLDIPPVVATEHRNDVCPDCSFFAFCCSELRLPVGHAEVLDDPDLEAWLERRHQVRPAHEDYDEADAESKALLKRYKVTLGPDGKAYWLVGSFLITVREIRPRGRAPYFTYEIWMRPADAT